MSLPRYGISLGARLLVSGRVRDALPYLIKPVNYWRTVEYAVTMREGDFAPSQDILDIGSPKLLALYLAETCGATVTATDIEPYFLDRLGHARAARSLPETQLRLMVEDGRALTYPDASFDRVYSISVLEHIPEEGDAQCMAEIVRVLRPGGRAVITVPFWPTSQEEYTQDAFYWSSSSTTQSGRGTFYQRRYSEEDLRARLVQPATPCTVRVQYVGERWSPPARREFSDLLPALTGPVQPLLSRLLHVGPVDDWRTLHKPLCAVLRVDKPQR